MPHHKRGMLHYSGGPATKVPTGDSLKEEIHGFEHKWGVPQSASAVDRTHIPIVTHCHPVTSHLTTSTMKVARN